MLLFKMTSGNDKQRPGRNNMVRPKEKRGGGPLISVCLVAFGKLIEKQGDDLHPCPVISDCRAVAKA